MTSKRRVEVLLSLPEPGWKIGQDRYKRIVGKVLVNGKRHAEAALTARQFGVSDFVALIG